MNTIGYIIEKIKTAEVLDFGAIFNESIELFKKVWLQGLIMLLINMAMMVPFIILLYLPLITLGIIDPEAMDNPDNAIIFIVPFIIFMIFFICVAMTITFALKAAFYRICKFKDLGSSNSEDYFYYLKLPYLGKVFQLALASVGISFLATLLCVIPVIYVAVPIYFMNIVFAFNPDLSVSNIIKASFELGTRKWLISIGLLIIAGFLAEIVGLMLCIVGIFFTASFAYLPLYIVYKKVVGFSDLDPFDEIKKIGQ
jgi:hypothetical protein